MRHTLIFPVLLLAAALSVSACSTSGAQGGGASAATDGTVSAQVQRGGDVYGEFCAGCHGDSGQGTRRGAPLVGEGALPLYREQAKARTGAFHNAMDIAVFATENMPPDEDDRAELKEADYWAVLAFALSANGVSLAEPVGPGNAASIVLHP